MGTERFRSVIPCFAVWWLGATGAAAGQEVLDTVTSQAATFVVEWLKGRVIHRNALCRTDLQEVSQKTVTSPVSFR